MRTKPLNPVSTPVTHAISALRGVGLVAILLWSACTHTARIEPGRTTFASVDAARRISTQRIQVQSVAGDRVRLRSPILTADSISGVLAPGAVRFSRPLSDVSQFSYRSRRRGIWDWGRIGAVAGTVAVPFLLERECDGCSSYAILLAPIGTVVGGIYGVIVGAVFGSTFKFRVSPGRQDPGNR